MESTRTRRLSRSIFVKVVQIALVAGEVVGVLDAIMTCFLLPARQCRVDPLLIDTSVALAAKSRSRGRLRQDV